MRTTLLSRALCSLLLLLCIDAAAGPGMWIPLLIGKNIDDMHAKGLKLSEKDIYDANNASLKDAVMIFGGGCTGEMVSEEGLILTNYHCGIDAVSSLSSVEQDYMGKGFVAHSRSEELACPGVEVRHLVYMKDVSEELNSEGGMSTIDNIIHDAEENGRYEVEMERFYGGNQAFIFVYEVFKDVRLVVAPPQQIGRFGGETDNWMWPRHTGDFTMFRVYANEKNEPAEYSSSNVPYVPKKHLKINIAGVKEGDFAMVIGYPGGTNQYLASSYIDAMRKHVWTKDIEIRTAQTNAMRRHMDADRKIEINYAANFSHIANGLKRTQGEIVCMRRAKMVEQIAAEQQALRQKDATINRSLETVENIVGDTIAPSKYVQNEITRRIVRSVLNAMTLYDFILTAFDFAETITTDKDLMAEIAHKFYATYDPTTERDVLIQSVKYMNEILPEDSRYKYIYNDPEKWADDFENSVFGSEESFLKMLNKSYKDPHEYSSALHDRAWDYIINLLSRLRDATRDNKEQKNEILDAEKQYISRLLQLYPDSLLMPDANFTMRVAYGNVEAPETGIENVDKWYTTTAQIIEKNKTGNIDYELSDELKTALSSGNYGDYGASDGTMHTCFVASIHTTGGNSGSPTLNGNGELVGINFDRIWHGVASDYRFDSQRSRNISVDIRYVLYIVDKICGATEVVNELEIVK